MAGKLEASLAILNGAIGDYLARTRNGLATETQVFTSTAGGEPLRLERDALAALGPRDAGPSPHIVVLVHGLMCNESIWTLEDGTDYGSRLADDLEMQPFYVRYNTGLAIEESGASLAEALSALVAGYPVPVEGITAIGHSMGGLVIRNACHAARVAKLPFVKLIERCIYLGTPHHGAPLERIGRAVSSVLRAVPDPYTRLIADIADARSRGIKDLGDGLRDARHPVPLLPEMDHFLVAASISDDPWVGALFGDVLVPVGSATAGHVDPRKVALPPSHVRVMSGAGHISLAHDPDVYDQILGWCRSPFRARAAKPEEQHP
jgi:pimeloyl-ACP methyl ester carboxylesterase